MKRLLLKTIIWRIVATLVTTFVAYFIFSSPKLDISIGIIDTVIKTVLYFGYELLWRPKKKITSTEVGKDIRGLTASDFTHYRL